ncbi:hypothetical protein N0M98_27200 [Paenibacillus doosanensis]|nr:hypothetical protein [Paenibacillus doosanensis]MCS7463797.1 hypothetical protein [Paenibacillus doosanensis]
MNSSIPVFCKRRAKAVYRQVKAFAIQANEQNLDRLEAVLAKLAE